MLECNVVVVVKDLKLENFLFVYEEVNIYNTASRLYLKSLVD